VTVGFRWPLLLRAGWQDTTVSLPHGGWREVLTGRDVQGGTQLLENLLDETPIALLERA
jgi:(1->4)-alpha-D-glucan 1-alpha-D-glucosylmutase